MTEWWEYLSDLDFGVRGSIKSGDASGVLDEGCRPSRLHCQDWRRLAAHQRLLHPCIEELHQLWMRIACVWRSNMGCCASRTANVNRGSHCLYVLHVQVVQALSYSSLRCLRLAVARVLWASQLRGPKAPQQQDGAGHAARRAYGAILRHLRADQTATIPLSLPGELEDPTF